MKYFINCNTLDELKKEFRRLAMIHHPDHGGDTATMQAINGEYEALFPRLKLIYNQTAAEPTHETAESFRNEFYTQNGFKGRNYKSSRTTKECTEEIRAYLKRAYPDCKFSVTTHYASMCSEIRVYLMAGPYPALKGKDYKDLNYFYMNNDEDLTEWGKAVMIDVNDCIKSYHFSDCDGMIDYFDVNFYYDIGVGRWDKPYQVNNKQKKLDGNGGKKDSNSEKNGAIRVVFNTDVDGVEVYFPEKPDDGKRAALKQAGYRWHNKKKCWYAKNTEQNLQSLRAIEAGA